MEERLCATKQFTSEAVKDVENLIAEKVFKEFGYITRKDMNDLFYDIVPDAKDSYLKAKRQTFLVNGQKVAEEETVIDSQTKTKNSQTTEE